MRYGSIKRSMHVAMCQHPYPKAIGFGSSVFSTTAHINFALIQLPHLYNENILFGQNSRNCQLFLKFIGRLVGIRNS